MVKMPQKMGHEDRFKTWKRRLTKIAGNGTCGISRILHALITHGVIYFYQDVSVMFTVFVILAVLIFQCLAPQSVRRSWPNDHAESDRVPSRIGSDEPAAAFSFIAICR
jgi:hypothetical protein